MRRKTHGRRRARSGRASFEDALPKVRLERHGEVEVAARAVWRERRFWPTDDRIQGVALGGGVRRVRTRLEKAQAARRRPAEEVE